MNPQQRSMPRLCLVEDDPVMGASLVSHMESLGLNPSWYKTGEEALVALDSKKGADIVISDVRLPDISGEELFFAIKNRSPDISCILITAYGTVDQAVRLIKEGLDDYITKPFEVTELIKKINYLTARRHENDLSKKLVHDLRLRMNNGNVVCGVTPQICEVEKTILKMRDLPTSLLLTGETGTGKEVMANLCHHSGSRANKPFVAIHCAALPSTLLEAELFGYEEGAFTGAVQKKQGKLELVEGGTLFLDEIGDIPLEIQVKLLRVLQERVFERLGGNELISTDFRLITATNRNLEKLIKEERFRDDLYYRINVVQVDIPPLRKRRDDILFFANYFLHFFSQQLELPLKKLGPRAEGALMAHDFPGNIRELRNLVERAMALSERDILGPEDIFPANKVESYGAESNKLKTAVAETERCLIVQALEENGYAVTLAAEKLGISRKTLWEKMKRHEIKAEEAMTED